ncbi:DNA-binding SARP family transcriptional activator [Streptomyces sp. 1114.5]|uniref:AfsR/SARP family transcriptional regulator n=1 Tax=Streptomyces sp. 1114.5 TaxID=1938830 RepID=UPI000EAEB935|nr:BTAD domain-containing putative transcriptional regulator [Streptomyces sp. 1114.5]RKT08916.1 DNA-binding SARP family transcriptional activator [Streptomyces sp. 1114.5]
MHIDLLGPVLVRREHGAAATPSGPKRRALLSALAVRMNQTVATEELIELVWDGAAPPTARSALQGHVAALRQLLDGTGLVLDTRASGYLLAGSPDRVDVLRFLRLCEQAGVLLPEPTGRVHPAGGAPEDPAVPLLRAGLDLWRGPALVDCGSALLRERVVPPLADLRLRALDRLAEALLRAGRGGELAAELAEAADAHPSRQALAARLVHCLEQGGRYQEARERYERATALLSGPPGPELRLVGERLRAQPASSAAPTTITAVGAATAFAAVVPDRRFVGRSAELAALDAALPAARSGRPVLVTGPVGAGKTALVRHWAALRGAERFPDGVLHADLRGFDPAGPRQPADVLGEFLTALGDAPDALPAATAERSRRYRDLVSGRRMLIVLDDAASYEQLLPLLPDPPATHPRPDDPGPDDPGPDDPGQEEAGHEEAGTPVTVVTSCGRLRHLLVREGGVPLPLGVLTGEDAAALLARALGPDRTGTGPEAVAELAELAERCDRLPLALRLAAARLVARPDWTPGDLARELADEQTGLAALSGPGSGTARGPIGLISALDRTYRTLTPDAARLFTLLGLHPGGVIDTATAAALADLPPATTRTLLTALDAVHLLEEATPGRYARRELVRRYAARKAAELTCDERFVALDRLIAHYLEVTAGWTAESAAAGGSDRAAAWFRREESALRAVVLCAEQYGRTAHAWQLAHRIGLLYETTGHDRTHWRAVVEAGLRAAHADGDDAAAARLGTDLAVLHIARAAHRTASEHLDRAVGAADRAGDPALRHHCRSRVGAALLRAGRYERALPLLTDLVAAARTPAADHLLVRSLTDLADALVLSGHPGPALDHADEAVRTATARAGSAEAVLAVHSRARALHALGRRDAALSSARLAVALGRTVGDPALEARSHGLLADLLEELGRGVEGAEARQRAQALVAGSR